MASRIEDYAVVGDTHTAALISKQGSVDWLCLPRFDSGACFAALLGTQDHGRWSLAPAGGVNRTTRRYRDETLVLETTHETNDGVVRVIDFMPPRGEEADLFRVVEGLDGAVPMHMDLRIRFDYGSIMPWVRRTAGGLRAVAGPDAVELWSEVDLRSEDFVTTADFAVRPNHSYAFSMAWHPSTEPRHPPLDHRWALFHTEEWWTRWASDGTYHGEWREAVMRSLLTLKALTYAPTGGIVAAATTSLPETLGGVRNWDYRYCWLRDATFTLYALMLGGYTEEAVEWREWLLRAVAGEPSQAQILYGVAGERLVPESELRWLPGYAGSAPVRVGNAAASQFQLDIYGEVMDALHTARRLGLPSDENAWHVQRRLVEYVERMWREPDDGIWEVRGRRRHFTHSKVMAWVALDRAVKAVERYGLAGPVERWRGVRARIHADVCANGYDPDVGAFVQFYGAGRLLDASLLMIPLVGFLPADDPRMRSTVKAIEAHLTTDGFVARYHTLPEVDGLPPGEGAFLPCSFWLADNLALQGRYDEADALFARLLSVRNDVGLLAEEYDPRTRRLLGNFPQAMSHMALINTAANLSKARGPAKHRKDG
ncbi:MAG TPA: glycoside hydrolase family 15 protein [Terriglobales bacterium]|nr:glycoside hydrolase family 15 protein [Terriglobales bacterium]